MHAMLGLIPAEIPPEYLLFGGAAVISLFRVRGADPGARDRVTACTWEKATAAVLSVFESRRSCSRASLSASRSCTGVGDITGLIS